MKEYGNIVLGIIFLGVIGFVYITYNTILNIIITIFGSTVSSTIVWAIIAAIILT